MLNDYAGSYEFSAQRSTSGTPYLIEHKSILRQATLDVCFIFHVTVRCAQGAKLAGGDSDNLQ